MRTGERYELQQVHGFSGHHAEVTALERVIVERLAGKVTSVLTVSWPSG
jgi:hypothetical protein